MIKLQSELAVKRFNGLERMVCKIGVVQVDDAPALVEPAAGHHDICGFQRPFHDLPADGARVGAPREGFSHHFSELRCRRNNAHRIAMHEDEACIGIDRFNGVERMNVIRAFQDPLARVVPMSRLLMLQMLKEALVKTVGAEMA